MNALTSALQVLIKSVWYKIYGWPIIILGIDSNGNPIPFTVSSSGGITSDGLTDTQLRALAVAVNSKVGATVVSGIQEVHTLSTESANFSVTAGSLYFTLLFSSDFTGTVNTVTWDITTKPNPLPVNAQPGNTLPAYAVVVTTGSVFVAQSRPA